MNRVARLFTKRRLAALLGTVVFVALLLRLVPSWQEYDELTRSWRNRPHPTQDSDHQSGRPPAPGPKLRPPLPKFPPDIAHPRPLPSQPNCPPTKLIPVSKPKEPVCAGWGNDLDVVIVVKTGATEASRRLPHQLVSFLSCIPPRNLLVFSDLEQTIGSLKIHDSLDNVAEEAKHNNTDFKLYHEQKILLLEGGNMAEMKDRGRESWLLDKYKNIHTAQKSWAMRPNADWYFFVDVDTYVVASSLFALLRRFDPSEPVYFGVSVPGEFGPFAHGGAGYGINRVLMESLNGPDAKKLAHDFDVDVRGKCCGDIEMSKPIYYKMEQAFRKKKGVGLRNTYPMTNGDDAANYRMGERIWCKPLVTMHHIGAEQINDLWQFERVRKNPEVPLTFGELWNGYLEHKIPGRRSDWSSLSEQEREVSLPAERENWDNLSEGWTYEPPQADKLDEKDEKSGTGKGKDYFLDLLKAKDSHAESWRSKDQCAKACKEKRECFTYTYESNGDAASNNGLGNAKCTLGKFFRFGERKKSEGNKMWTSGWDLDKIKKFKDDKGACREVDYKSYLEGS